MANKGHVTQSQLDKLHKEGACLTRHQRRAPGNKCSHQWQAQKHAESDPTLYNYPRYYTLCDWKPGGILATALKTVGFPPGYARADLGEWLGKFWRDKPTHAGKEWDVGKDNNFQHWIKPFWQNAHHIIPNRALASAISDAAKRANEARLINLIKQGLLKAEYNLNDEINMVILPMEKIVAAGMALPRHLKRDESGPNEKGEFFSHADYSKKVEIKLASIMMNYVETLAKALQEEHEGPPDEISKQQLEDLSREIYNSLKKSGGFIAGKALAELKF